MTIKHAKLIMIAFFSIANVVDLCACVTTLINDKAARLIVYNKADKTLIFMRKSEKRRFGNQHQPAYFALYIQEPKKQIFTRRYTCKQKMCSDNSNLQLKLSDIEKGTAAADLFDIKKNAPYVSMVQKHCESCSGK
jgi:hypothetical protein